VRQEKQLAVKFYIIQQWSRVLLSVSIFDRIF